MPSGLGLSQRKQFPSSLRSWPRGRDGWSGAKGQLGGDQEGVGRGKVMGAILPPGGGINANFGQKKKALPSFDDPSSAPSGQGGVDRPHPRRRGPGTTCLRTRGRGRVPPRDRLKRRPMTQPLARDMVHWCLRKEGQSGGAERSLCPHDHAAFKLRVTDPNKKATRGPEPTALGFGAPEKQRSFGNRTQHSVWVRSKQASPDPGGLESVCGCATIREGGLAWVPDVGADGVSV